MKFLQRPATGPSGKARLGWTALLLIAFQLFATPALAATYTVSGNTGVGSAKVTPTGGTAITSSSTGAYSFTGVPAGTYTLTVSKAGYAFSPSSKSVTVSTANVSGINFTATGIYTVKGNTGVAGVKVTPTGGTAVTSDASGNYTFSQVPPGAYTLTPSKAGYTFSPSSKSVTVSTANISGVNFTATGIYTVKGNTGVGGVKVTPTGGTAVTSDASGNYTFSQVPPGAYTLTPSKAGYSFSPTSKSVTVSTASLIGVNFAASVLTHIVSGNTGIDEVKVTANTGAFVTSDINGNYSFSGVAPGTYTLTPSKVGFNFSPKSKSVTVSTANVTGVSFAVVPVVVSGNTGVDDVKVTAAGHSIISDASGNYSFSGVPPGTYTLTPSKPGYKFSPTSKSVTVSTASVTGLSFTAIPVVVSGNTGIGGVTLTASSGASTISDANGNYSFSGAPPGTYTLTPSKAGWAFSPWHLTITVSTSNITGRNFTAAVAYTVSGNTGAEGVTVTANTGHSTISDANGNYRFIDVPRGSYTLTPSRNRYSFSPSAISGTVSNNVSGVNFAVTSIQDYPDASIALADSWGAKGPHRDSWVKSILLLSAKMGYGFKGLNGRITELSGDPKDTLVVLMRDRNQLVKYVAWYSTYRDNNGFDLSSGIYPTISLVLEQWNGSSWVRQIPVSSADAENMRRIGEGVELGYWSSYRIVRGEGATSDAYRSYVIVGNGKNRSVQVNIAWPGTGNDPNTVDGWWYKAKKPSIFESIWGFVTGPTLPYMVVFSAIGSEISTVLNITNTAAQAGVTASFTSFSLSVKNGSSVSQALVEGLKSGAFAYTGSFVLNQYGSPTSKVGVAGAGCPTGDKCWFMELLNGVPPIKKLAELHDPFVDWSVGANASGWYKAITIPPFIPLGCAAVPTCVTAGIAIASESEGR